MVCDFGFAVKADAPPSLHAGTLRYAADEVLAAAAANQPIQWRGAHDLESLVKVFFTQALLMDEARFARGPGNNLRALLDKSASLANTNSWYKATVDLARAGDYAGVKAGFLRATHQELCA